MLEEKNH